MGGKSKKTTIGYSYFMGLHMGLCRGPVDAIRQIRVGDKVAWTGSLSGNGSIYIDQPALFGGEEQEGGIQGNLTVLMGAKDQPRHAGLASMLGGLVSAFRGVTTTFFDGLVCAMSPYPKEWAYLVQKTKAGWHNGECWYPEKCEIDIGSIREAVQGSWPWVTRTNTFVVGATHEYTGSYLQNQGWWKGWIDSFRVTKGVARYAQAEYEIPSSPFGDAFTDPNYADVVLLMRMDGDDGSASFVDEKGHSVSLIGHPHLDSGKSKFGRSSAYFNGVSDGLLVSMGSDADLGHGPWTLDAWVWLESMSSDAFSFGLFGHGQPNVSSSDTRWDLWKTARWVYHQAPETGKFEPLLSQSIAPFPVSGRWMFVSVCWDGSQYWMHQDGKLLTGSSAGVAMNPAHILRRLYTDPAIGRGLDPATRLDEDSWRMAADAFHAEGFGLCMKWSRSDSVANFAGEVLNHAGAALYTSRRTGKIVLKPIRADYVIDDLPLFTPDTGLLGIDDDESSAQSGGINEIVVKWVDPIEKADSAVREKNLGAILAARGVAVCEEVSYPGVPTESLARRVARRDLQAKSGFIKRITVRLDRRGKDIMPGHVFRISDPTRGIANMILRAGRVEFGTITDGAITVTALQDIFGLPAAVYRESEENAYVPPDTLPRIPAYQTLMEAPYRELAQAMSTADLAALDPASGFLHAMAIRPAGMAQSFQLQTRVSPAEYVAAVDTAAWCPGGKLTYGIGPLDTLVELSDAIDLDLVAIGTAALMGSEIIRIDAVDVENARLTIARGCVDTVPAAQKAGIAVLCYDGWGADETKEYTAGVTAEAKLLTRTGAGVLDMSLAPVQTITFASRASRPFPPAGLRINGQLQPDFVIGSMEVVWVSRNRVTQADNLVDASMAAITPEANTTYTVRTFINQLLVDEQESLSDTTTDILLTVAGACLIEVWAVRDGLESWQAANVTFTYRPTPWVPYVDQAGSSYADQYGNIYEG